MKISIDDARAALAVLSNVAVSPAAESSQYVRLKVNKSELTMTMTGLIWAEARVTGSEGGIWTAYVERRAFKAFLDTATGKDLELFYKDQLVLRSGQRLEVAPHAPITGYESWEPKSTISLTGDQKLALKTAVKYLPEMAGADHVNAVWFAKDFGVIATDTLWVMGVQDSPIKTDFFLPASIANVLANDGLVGIDKAGVGAVLMNGVVYEPMTGDLDGYPKDGFLKALTAGTKAKTLVTVKARDLLEVLRTASMFLLDNNAVVTMENAKGRLSATVNLGTGKFQRTIPVAGIGPGLDAPTDWLAKKIIPWLEYAVARKDDAEIRIAKTPNADVLKSGSDILVFSNL
jgi:hypothetical protein